MDQFGMEAIKPKGESNEASKEKVLADLPQKAKELIESRGFKILKVTHEGFQDNYKANIEKTIGPNYHLWVIDLEGGGKIFAVKKPDRESAWGKMNHALMLHTKWDMSETEEWVYYWDGGKKVEVTYPNLPQTEMKYEGQTETVELGGGVTLDQLMDLLHNAMPQHNRVVDESVAFSEEENTK